MLRLLTISMLAAVILAAPAFAAASVSDVTSDMGAVTKDSLAIGSANLAAAQDRVAKAKDKATGNWSGQAMDSMKIGMDKMKSTEKGVEMDVDKKILSHDVDSATGK